MAYRPRQSSQHSFLVCEFRCWREGTRRLTLCKRSSTFSRIFQRGTASPKAVRSVVLSSVSGSEAGETDVAVPTFGGDRALVVVESPAKAKTIQKFLPEAKYVVQSCVGHVRDLPDSAKRIPAKFKGLPWARLGVDVENGFAPLYIVLSGKQPVIKRLKGELASCSSLILATDEDREGEAIAWHLIEVLKPKVPVSRAVFHEITEDAVVTSFEHRRDINLSLVKAQETRRILDRLAGYTMSPLLWRKVARGLSAGRVQSVALDYVVKREFARLRFVPAEYWDASLVLESDEIKGLHAKLFKVGGKRVATGGDFDDDGKLTKDDLFWFKSEEELSSAISQMKEPITIEKVDRRKVTRQPPVPFTTSTMQQAANNRFNISAAVVMRTAQRLYEAGYITYMRTDSAELSKQAIIATKEEIVRNYGEKYLRTTPVSKKKSSTKNAQEAHEAIRPAGKTFLAPNQLPMDGFERSLYKLIYERTLASQMAPSEQETMTITLTDKDSKFVMKSTGSRVVFPGFRAAYAPSELYGENPSEDKNDAMLPDLDETLTLSITDKMFQKRLTQAPPRYSDASLVKEMETSGVGRPSTYSAIIETLENRDYMRRINSRYFAPTITAFAVDSLLSKFFPDYVDSEFTARMESELDLIAKGEGDAQDYLTRYYLDEENGLKNAVEQKAGIIDKSVKEIHLPGLQDSEIALYVGPFGPYLERKQTGEKVTVPQDILPEDINSTRTATEFIKRGEDPMIGTDPESGLPVLCKLGPFGPYVQLGVEGDPEGGKVKRASLPKGVHVGDVDIQTALKVLSLPRTLGTHPDSGQPVVATNGRFGPYVSHEGVFVSLGKEDDVFEIEMERAMSLLRDKEQRQTRMLRTLGEFEGQSVEVWQGRFGPYIKYMKANLKLPKEMAEQLENITLKDVEQIVNEKWQVIEAKKNKAAAVASKKATAEKAKKQAAKSSKSTPAKSRKSKAAKAPGGELASEGSSVTSDSEDTSSNGAGDFLLGEKGTSDLEYLDLKTVAASGESGNLTANVTTVEGESTKKPRRRSSSTPKANGKARSSSKLQLEGDAGSGKTDKPKSRRRSKSTEGVLSGESVRREGSDEERGTEL